MNAHNLKIVELHSRTENYTAERKMNFSSSFLFLIAHSLLLAYFEDIFNFLPFLPEFFPSTFLFFIISLFLSPFLVPCAWYNREYTFALNFYGAALALTFFSFLFI